MDKKYKKLIEEIKKIVKARVGKNEADWFYHIVPMVRSSIFLAKKYKADEKTIEIAAWLHDIGRLPFTDKKHIVHHIIGAKEAGIILKNFNWPEEKIKKIQRCILCHKRDSEHRPETIEEKIIANADAMTHFDMLPVFFHWRTIQGDDFEAIVRWVESKLDGDWKTKLTLSEAKKAVRVKYLLNKKILKNLKEVRTHSA